MKRAVQNKYGTGRTSGGFPASRSSGAADEKTFSIFQPDILATSQYFQHTRRKQALEPEKKLILAILQDAVECFQKHLFSENTKAKTLFQDAEEWIMEKNSECLFSFEGICESLGLNGEYIRNGLMKWKRHAVSKRGKRAQVYHLSRHRRKQSAVSKTKHVRALKVAGI